MEGLRGEGVVMVGSVDVGSGTVVTSEVDSENAVVGAAVVVTVDELEEKVVEDVVVVVGSCVRISTSVSGLSFSTFRHQIV